eukprot:scaffold130770_cov32-Tisochrysis_lutea.AAC.4
MRAREPLPAACTVRGLLGRARARVAHSPQGKRTVCPLYCTSTPLLQSRSFLLLQGQSVKYEVALGWHTPK